MAELAPVRAYIEGVAQANRKVALVASIVRNRTVADALVILSHTPKRAALPVPPLMPAWPKTPIPFCVLKPLTP